MQLIRDWLGSGLSIVLVVAGLGLIIFIHELGHFLMAKKNRVKVEIFSLGFGPAIWKFRRGETEYRVSWFPLGGYVKMAGETLTDDRKGDPSELTSKTPWQRFQIFVAGATMNLLIAYPIAIGAYMVGKYESTNVVGSPGLAEARGGMLPGDVIVDVDGRKIESLDKFRIEMVRRQSGTQVPVTVVRKGQQVKLLITTRKSAFHATTPPTRSLHKLPDDSPLASRIGERDEVVSVDGTPYLSGAQIDSVLRNSPGKEVTLGIQHRAIDLRDPPPFDVRVNLSKTKTWYLIPEDDALQEPIVNFVKPGMPAWGRLQPGDVIKKINDKSVVCWQDLRDVVEKSISEKGAVDLKFTLVRGGEVREEVLTPTWREGGVMAGVIGIGPKMTSVFARVTPGSVFDKAKIQSGDRLYSYDGTSGEVTLAGILGAREAKPKTIKLKVIRAGAPDPIDIDLVAEEKVEADLAAAGLPVHANGQLVIGMAEPFRRRPAGEAVMAGLSEPYDLVIMTFDVLRKLLAGNESAKGLTGPIGIIHASYTFAQDCFGKFLWLLCLITVNLGVFNLLPIPVLDGGHNVLLLIEVVRKWLGKPPPSEKFVAGFQYAGLFFVLALFLLVTFNDLNRFFGRG